MYVVVEWLDKMEMRFVQPGERGKRGQREATRDERRETSQDGGRKKGVLMIGCRYAGLCGGWMDAGVL